MVRVRLRVNGDARSGVWICPLCDFSMNEDDYEQKYIQGMPCKHYICAQHANDIYGGAHEDWQAAAEARGAVVLATTMPTDG